MSETNLARHVVVKFSLIQLRVGVGVGVGDPVLVLDSKDCVIYWYHLVVVVVIQGLQAKT